MPDIIHEVNGGFFDSINQDRLYNASQMSMPYKRIVSDGIFPDENGTPSGDFLVSLSSGMVVLVAPGNALVGGKWAESVDSVEITIAGNSSGYTRIDSIVLRADTSEAVRAVGIVYKQGEESANPVAPALTNNGTITELRIADITVPAGTAALSAENIVDQRGTADCPWVHGLIPPTQAQVEESVTDYLEDNPGIFVVDSAFSDSSTNAVQNRVVAAAVGQLTEDVADVNDRLMTQEENILELQEGGYVADQQQIAEKINAWLADHPEATTTVQDGAITLPKINDNALPFIANGGYVVQNVGDQLGAKVNAALSSYDVVIVPEGDYTLETKIIVPNRKTLVVHGDILYNGEDAAIELTNTLYCNVHVNKIQAPNGSCIRVKATDNNLNEFNEIHSMYLYGKYCIDILNEGTSGIQHINFYSNYVRAIERCVSIVSTQQSGWNGELKFFGGEFNGSNAVGVYSNKSLTALRMFGVGFETLANILDITDASEITMTGCRNEGAGKYIFSGVVRCVLITGDYYTRRSIDIDGLANTNGIVFKGIIYNDDNAVCGTELCIAPDMKMSITGCSGKGIAYAYHSASRPIIGDKNDFPFIVRLTTGDTTYFLSENYTVSAQKEVIVYAEKSGITLKNHDGTATLFTTTEPQSVWRVTSAEGNSYFSPSGYLVEKITPYKQS